MSLPDDAPFALRGYGPREAVLWRTVAIPSFRRPRAVLVRARDPVVVPGLGTYATLHGLGFVDIVAARGLRVTIQRSDP